MRRRLIAAIAFLTPVALAAQGIRVTGVTSVQFFELRPLVADSADASTVPGTGEWRTTADGLPAHCVSGNPYCTFERSGSRINATPLLQDIGVAAWGLTEGLSFHADLRARTQLSSDGLVYPRSDQHLDALDVYAEYERDRARAKLGRQWITGGLGAYNFDGADLQLRRNRFTLEGWGGRALAAGLGDTHTSSELAAVENLPPEEDGYVWGGRGSVHLDDVTTATLLYQRVTVADHSGLYSERMAFDATTRKHGASVAVALTYDLATGDWNEARLRVGTAGRRTLGLSAEVRHSQPFFELWTIWGAFTPVGFDEVRGLVDWRPARLPFAMAFRGGYLRYDNAGTSTITMRTNGWRAGTDVTWLGSGRWTASGSYDMDFGFGASRTDGRLGARWRASSALEFGLDLSALQNMYEFRIGTGRVFGASLDGSIRLANDLRLAVDAGLYRQQLTDGAAGPDWTQRRASARLEWTVGGDPGLAMRKAK